MAEGSLRWVPVYTGTTVAPHIVIPATAGIHGVGSLRWVPVYTGTTVAPTSSFPRRRESTGGGACDGFPSTRERRRRTSHRHSRDGGNPRRGETAMGSRLHGNDGGTDGAFPRRHTAVGWVPVSTGTRPHRHCRRRESTAWGSRMGSRLHGNDGRRRAPHGTHIVIPATAGIHGGGSLRWVPVYTGTTVAPHIVIRRDGGNPRRGETGDGFPSPRERR